jgi:hypothetical protein
MLKFNHIYVLFIFVIEVLILNSLKENFNVL